MAYIQGNVPPPNKILTFSLNQFSGGLNNRSVLLKENEASSLMNMAFADDTVMEKRRGTMAFDDLTLPSEVVYIDEYKPYNDDDILIRATATQLYFGNVKVKDISGQITGINFVGKYFFSDGSKVHVYGLFPQSSSTNEVIIGTPVNAYTILELVNPPSGFTPLDTTHQKGVVKYDYTNKKVWYEPCANEIADTFKQGNVIPTNPRFLCIHNGRLFISGNDKDDDNVFISDVNNPYYFPASLPMQLPPNSDKVIGLHVYDGGMVVGRENDIYVIVGVTNRTDSGQQIFQLRKINSHTGFASHHAVSVANNYLFFLGNDGNAYALQTVQGTNDALMSSILTKSINLFKAPIGVTMADLSTAKSIFFDDKWYVTIKDKVVIYSYRHQAWTVYQGLNARSFYKYHNVLIWGDTSGRISMPSENYLDYGIPYRAYWTSKNFDMGDSNSQKQFREFFLVAHTFEGFSSDVLVTFDVDYVDVKNRITISNQLSVWGKSRFGDRFINRNINASLPFVIGRRGRNIRFTFSNGHDVQTTVATLAELDGIVGKAEGSLAKVTEDNNYHLFLNNEWMVATTDMLNQAMRIYEMNGEYEFRGKR